MLSLDLTNIASGKIGTRHGIANHQLKERAQKYQPLTRELFRAQDKNDFLKLPDDQALLRKIRAFSTKQKKWENLVVLGIGGSALGTIAAQDALLGPLHNEFKKPKLYVLDNIDPAYTDKLFAHLDFSKTLFIVISKSGTTVEPMTLYALAKERLIKKSPKGWQKHFAFITDPKSGLLRKIGKEEGIAMFDVPPGVGGRYSVLSSVGLVPLALAGVDVGALLKGAREMRELIKKSKAEKNPALLLALIQFLLHRKKGKVMTIMMPYSKSLFRLGDWYRQLLAESIGKSESSGPTPLNALGTTDQHSQLQLWNEGPNNKFIIFLHVLKHSANPKVGKILPKELDMLNVKKMSVILEAALQGTAESLAHHKRPNLRIDIPKVDAPNLGALFMLFECQVALLGKLYQVNAFNQPGVEMSKKITKELLSK